MNETTNPSRCERQNLFDSFERPVRESVRALLIDDDSVDQTLIKHLAASSRQLNFTLIPCGATGEAKAILDAEPFDILFVDYWMGLHTSVDFISDLSRHQAVPSVLLSGLDEPDIRRIAFRAGAKGFLSKNGLSVQAIDSVTLSVLSLGGHRERGKRPAPLSLAPSAV